MGSIRVTQGILVSRTLDNISAQMRRVADYQERLGTGLRVNHPSDNPIDARRAINTRVQIAKNGQYLDNMESVGPQLLETVTASQAVVDMLHRAHELTLQGATGTNAAPQREAIALEINQLLESVVAEANHQTDGKFVFGGSRTLTPAFTVGRDAQGDISSVTYEGNDVVNKVSVAEGITINTNVPGDEVFQGTVDIFQVLIGIRDDLRAGNQDALNTTHLDNLDAAQVQLLKVEAQVGAIQNRAERLKNDMEDVVFRLEELLSDTIDADYTDTIVNLNAHTNALTAALQAGGRVIQPSLLDFIG
jgi:flagellar hook-associated protein 3 FlgL